MLEGWYVGMTLNKIATSINVLRIKQLKLYYTDELHIKKVAIGSIQEHVRFY